STFTVSSPRPPRRIGATMPSRPSSSRRRTASRRWSPQNSQRRISTFIALASYTLRWRQHRDQRIEVLYVRRQLTQGMLAHGGGDGVVERRRLAGIAALGGHVAVQEVHLGAAALQHVLQQRWPSARASLGLGGQVGLDLREPAPLGGVDHALRVDAANERLDRVAVRAAGTNDFGAELDGDAPWARLPPQLGGAHAGEPR